MSDVTRISPAEALAKMKDEGFTYVDVRTEEEFEAGHPEGAVNVPWNIHGAAGMTPNPEFAEVMERAFDKNAPMILGCKTGNRSMHAARALIAAGFTNLVEQRAGWDGAKGSFGEVIEPGWSRIPLPSEKGIPEGRSYAALRTGASFRPAPSAAR
jgi:rhodanese-related sulfurtransferase